MNKRTELSQSSHELLRDAAIVRLFNSRIAMVVSDLRPLRLSCGELRFTQLHVGPGWYATGTSAAMHQHREIQFEFVVKGRFEFADGTGIWPLSDGQAVAIAPGILHHWRCQAEGLMVGGMVEIHGRARDEVAAGLREQAGSRLRKLPGRLHCARLAEILVLAINRNPVSWRQDRLSDRVRGLLTEALLAAFDCTPWTEALRDPAETVPARTHETAAQARRFMEANYARPLTLRDVALQVGVSPRHLSRLYRSQFNDSVANALIQVRLRKARELLEAGVAGSIKEIAYATGFSSPAYFAAYFRKKFHVRPSDLFHRRNHL